MDFSWDAEEERFYEHILNFARGELAASSARREAAHRLLREDWEKCGQFGLLGLCVPEEYGGMGFDSLHTARAIEALGRGCPDMGLVFSVSAHLFACVMPILESGSPDQRRAFVPKLVSGEWIGANAITEGDAGSDAFALQTRAVRDGDRWSLSGSKTYVSNGPDADLFLVYATSDPSEGYLGIEAFVVERGTPGLVIGEPFEKMGLRSSPIGSIYLQDCLVPEANHLGKGGDGARIFTRSMHWERNCLFAGYLGQMERVVEQCARYAAERKQFRKPIGKNQAISHRIADMKMRLEAARLMLYRACWLRDRGEEATMEVAMAKVMVSEAAIQTGLDAVQIYGGIGYMTETGIESILRDAVPSTIFSGTSEIQRNLIASRMGL